MNSNKSDEIIIREANERDAAGVVKYLKQNQDHFRYMISRTCEMDLSVEYERDMIRRHALRENCEFFVAVDGDKIVGMLNFVAGNRLRNSHDGEFGISVDRNYAGMGIGSALVEALIEWATEINMIRRLTLFVMNGNERAISLYQKYGFRIEGVRRRAVRFEDGRVQDLIMMGKLKKEGSNEWIEDTE
ncbi:MAG TPA: GNAT family N-acetyltransferase [Thermotogota bacterium]|nr:GNAT family N-acetyltransferase [Thermotogota bacterium]HPJ88038.1 GNAT family N-acetyltransferase [Thermotogota bacterium]HPR96223.1 GNAT family N-acetyltransferase [Thermotogota bacterium]